ncbi:hypothetical protein SDJN03_20264, partial [Cucurbita argyrosperma subsp. sororia]
MQATGPSALDMIDEIAIGAEGSIAQQLDQPSTTLYWTSRSSACNPNPKKIKFLNQILNQSKIQEEPRKEEQKPSSDQEEQSPCGLETLEEDDLPLEGNKLASMEEL